MSYDIKVMPTVNGTNVSLEGHNHNSDYLPIGGGTLTGALKVPIGSAGTPSYSFTDDNTTGIYSPTDGSIAMTGNGDPFFYINTTTDNYIVLGKNRTVAGHSYIDFWADAVTLYDARLIRWTGTDGTFDLVNKGAGALRIIEIGAGDIEFHTTSIKRVTITAAGNVEAIGNITGAIHYATSGSWSTGYRFSTGDYAIIGNTTYLIIHTKVGASLTPLLSLRTDSNSFLNLGVGDSTSRDQYIQFFAYGTAPTTVSAHIKRKLGINGVFEIYNTGTGAIEIKSSGQTVASFYSGTDKVWEVSGDGAGGAYITGTGNVIQLTIGATVGGGVTWTGTTSGAIGVYHGDYMFVGTIANYPLYIQQSNSVRITIDATAIDMLLPVKFNSGIARNSNNYAPIRPDNGFTLAYSGTQNLGLPFGIFYILCSSDATAACFLLRGGGNTTVLLWESSALHSVTKSTSGKNNVYYESGAYYLQNYRTQLKQSALYTHKFPILRHT